MSQVLAPEFTASIDWLNADRQTLAAHKGRVVAIFFWNASSVYCHTVFAQLQLLQKKFPEALSALSIHLPKFNAEQDSKTISEAVNRLCIQLPVANDKDWSMWQLYDIKSWPTVVLVDTNGLRVADFSGDDVSLEMESKITELMKASTQFVPDKSQALKAKPTPKPTTSLNSPSALLLHNDTLYISDSGSHRVYECTLEGVVKRIFGNGLPLNLNGSALEAGFNMPRGLAADRDYLYVADTGNHSIRRIHLLKGEVDTLLGTGIPGKSLDKKVNVFHDVALNNPTSMVFKQEAMFIADSGNNAIAMYNLATHAFQTLAGSDELGFVDGIGVRAHLAHPLALASSQNEIYMLEGSSSSIRTVAVPEGRVNTLLGQGLFQFGCEDGQRQTALLQHPSALVFDEKRQKLWIADSYNHKLRTYCLQSQLLSTITLTHELENPCALALDHESLWILDSSSTYVYRYYFASEYLARLSLQIL